VCYRKKAINFPYMYSRITQCTYIRAIVLAVYL